MGFIGLFQVKLEKAHFKLDEEYKSAEFVKKTRPYTRQHYRGQLGRGSNELGRGRNDHSHTKSKSVTDQPTDTVIGHVTRDKKYFLSLAEEHFLILTGT